jgi:hypothetical protein
MTTFNYCIISSLLPTEKELVVPESKSRETFDWPLVVVMVVEIPYQISVFFALIKILAEASSQSKVI